MLQYRKARFHDLESLVQLLHDDELGAVRESVSESLDSRYEEAFRRIDQDPNHYLMVLEQEGKILGMCHLTLLPSLSLMGSLRLQIESVRIALSHRGQGLGEAMIQEAIRYGQKQGAKIIQLTTHKQRIRAHAFYEKLGFKATHEGMKLYLEAD